VVEELRRLFPVEVPTNTEYALVVVPLLEIVGALSTANVASWLTLLELAYVEKFTFGAVMRKSR
jgi:hypothetical protein